MADFTVEKNTGKFEIRVAGSKKVYSLPLWNHLPARVAMDAAKAQRKGDEADAGFVLFDFIDDQCPGLVDIITQEQLMDIVRAWRGDEVELGE